MLEPKLIRNDLDSVAAQLKKRGFTVDVAHLTALENQRKEIQSKLQELQNERNVRSKAVGVAKAKGENVDSLMQAVKEIGDTLKNTEEQFAKLQSDLHELLAKMPNIPHESVPFGTSEKDNLEIRKWGQPTQFSFQPKDHVDIGAKFGMDFTAAAKISGARFVVLKGPLARLQRALIQFMLDLHTKEHGYQEIYVPYLVSADSLFGTGQLPNLRGEQFEISGANPFFLIPTAEVPVTNIVRDTILESGQLPLKFVCHSSCFRSEAGSYGKDTRGMIRNHQFEKVELVQIVRPELSYQVLEELTQHAETVLQRLELPYRVVALCTGDIGFSAAKTYDLEVWLPAQQCYREISSCSNFESFQARRLQARFRNPDSGKPELVHTLNGSGLAVGRTLVAILENYQDEQGRIHIPQVLRSYLDGLTVIE